ncbi:MAG: hypothetical protein M1812_008571, partial [Candelaria pacifica]
DDDIIVLVLCGALSIELALVTASFFLRRKKIYVEGEVDERKEELVREHISSLGEKEGGANACDLGEKLSTYAQTPTEGTITPLAQGDIVNRSDLGNSLCKIDEACRSLLDFAQALSSNQELNDQVLFYGVFPIAMVDLFSLGLPNNSGSQGPSGPQGPSGSGGALGPGESWWSQDKPRVQQRLAELEKQAKYQLNLDERLERVEKYMI